MALRGTRRRVVLCGLAFALALLCLALAGCGTAPADETAATVVAEVVAPTSTVPPTVTPTPTTTATTTRTATASPTATRTATPLRLVPYPSRGWVIETYFREVPDELVDWDTQTSNVWMSAFYDRIGYTPPLLQTLRAQEAETTTPAPVVGKVDCAALPDDTLLTSPVDSAEHVAAVDLRYPLGWLFRDLFGDIYGTAFQLQPGTEIYAPISGRLEQHICHSWEDTVYTVLTIYHDDLELSLLLPVYYYPASMPASAEEFYRGEHDVCQDCVELIGLVESTAEEQGENGVVHASVTVGRDWVERGELLAVYHSGSLPVGGFSANLVVGMVHLSEAEGATVVPILPVSDVWFTGAPAFCAQ